MCSTNPKTSSPNISAWSLSRTAAPLGLFYLTEVLVGLTDLAVVGALGPHSRPHVSVGVHRDAVENRSAGLARFGHGEAYLFFLYIRINRNAVFSCFAAV